MATPPKLSVVIPCFNARPLIAATLRSVLTQEGFELEVIVVDDGSLDGSADMVASEFPTVRLLRQGNQGVAAARNLGIAHASHEWVAFLDADDLWLPGKLAAQWEQLQADPLARMACSAWQVWVSTEPEPSAAFLADLHSRAADTELWAGPSGWIYPELLLDCVVWTSTVIAQRALLRELGGFDAELRIGEDYDLWLRASQLTPILRIQQPLALYRQHPGNVTRGVPKANHRGEVISSALERWGCRSADGRLADEAAVVRGLARSWSDLAGAQLLAGNDRDARSSTLKALRMDPRQWLAWKLLVKITLHAMQRQVPRRG